LKSYIADKYAGMLTEDDVENLFNLLVAKLGGNRSEAARRCGLTGKATYDWVGAAYVKLGTKQKVLEASLRTNFLATVEYLLNQSTERNLDLLRTILGTFYANALESTSQNDFKSGFEKFEAIRTRHSGLIRDGIYNEVADMATSLRDKAEQLGLRLQPKVTNELSAEELINAIQLVGRIYVENPAQAETLAVKEIGLPLDAVKPIITTFQNLCFTREMQANTMADLHEKTKPPTVSAERLSLSGIYESLIAGEGTLTRQVEDRFAKGGISDEIATRA
jgi:hypothetical protein